ncbi:LCI31 [Auxenochlorella protothecoides x Auxenochlorella symbiontica]
MPACEGIEVVAAAHGQHNPRLMPEGPQADLPPLAATREAEGRPAKPRPGISYVPGVPSQDGFDYAQFAKRYDEQVRKLLTRMGKNADYMVTYAKQQWQTFVGSGERRH